MQQCLDPAHLLFPEEIQTEMFRLFKRFFKVFSIAAVAVSINNCFRASIKLGVISNKLKH